MTPTAKRRRYLDGRAERKRLRTALEDIAGYILPTYDHGADVEGKVVPFAYANALREMAQEALSPSEDEE